MPTPRLTGLILLAVAREALGSLDKIKQVVKVLGMGQLRPRVRRPAQRSSTAAPTSSWRFLAKKGATPARPWAMGSLPLNTTVEIEVIFEVD